MPGKYFTENCSEPQKKAEELSPAVDCGCAYGIMEEDEKVDKDLKEACRINPIDFWVKRNSSDNRLGVAKQ